MTRGRWAIALAALMTACLAVLGLGGTLAVPAWADTCPNAALRAQNNSTELPDCRAYEMVSNPYKEGLDPSPQDYVDDGVFAYTSLGSFAGNGWGALVNQYVATRSASGWQTAAYNPSGPTYYPYPGNGAEALSRDLRLSLWQMRRADEPAARRGYYLREADGSFARIGDNYYDGILPTTYAASDDLSHVLFRPFGTARLLEYVGTDNDGPARAVDIDNTGQEIFSTNIVCANAMSGDGRVIVFTPSCQAGIPQVWARINGTTSVHVSASECTRSSGDPGGACNGQAAATYVDAPAGGSSVFFTTTQQLVNADTDATNDLYRCDLPPGTPAPSGVANPCASLTEVSGAASGANVEGVARVSQDGSHAYFVAQGVLANNLGIEDVGAVPGANNLYVWEKDAAHPTGATSFIATIDANDISGGQAQTTADGRYLVFATASALVDSGPSADLDANTDVYRYDAETQTIIRLSTATSSQGGNQGLDATINTSLGTSRRPYNAMTADASTVVFQTDEALSSNDTDGVGDVYAWHDGQVSLISDRGGRAPAITSSGTDIFFLTNAQLTNADGDAIPDIYDARVGGGFDLPRPTPCAGDACHSPQDSPPALGEPAPPTPPQPADAPAATPSLSLRSLSAAQRKALASTGRVTLSVTTNTPGIVRVGATATIGRKAVTVGTARQTLTTAGTVLLPLSLSTKARAQLAAKGRLTVKLIVSHSKVAVSRSATLKLTRARKAPKRSTVHRALAAAVAGDRS